MCVFSPYCFILIIINIQWNDWDLEKWAKQFFDQPPPPLKLATLWVYLATVRQHSTFKIKRWEVEDKKASCQCEWQSVNHTVKLKSESMTRTVSVTVSPTCEYTTPLYPALTPQPLEDMLKLTAETLLYCQCIYLLHRTYKFADNNSAITRYLTADEWRLTCWLIWCVASTNMTSPFCILKTG